MFLILDLWPRVGQAASGSKSVLRIKGGLERLSATVGKSSRATTIADCTILVYPFQAPPSPSTRSCCPRVRTLFLTLFTTIIGIWIQRTGVGSQKTP